MTMIDDNTLMDSPADACNWVHHTTAQPAIMETMLSIKEDVRQRFQRSAEWRKKKAKEYPNDKRNVEAVNSLRRLTASVVECSHDVLIAYQRIWDDEGANASEVWSETLRPIGFSSDYETAEALLCRFIDAGRSGELF